MDGLQRGSAAIVGVAESDLGAVAQDMSPIDLMAQGIQRALADCNASPATRGSAKKPSCSIECPFGGW